MGPAVEFVAPLEGPGIVRRIAEGEKKVSFLVVMAIILLEGSRGKARPAGRENVR